MSLSGELPDGTTLGRGDRLEMLLQAAADLAGEHDLDQVLTRLLHSAAILAGARYAALGIYDASGRIERFLHHGMDADTVARIDHYPEGLGLLGEVIVTDRPIRIDDLAADPRRHGFPPHHPPMRSFLGVPVRSGDRRHGNLYLTDKEGGGPFTEDDERLVVSLAAFAAAAVEGVQLVAAERERAEARAGLAAAEERARAHRQVLGQIIGAQEAERARVARDLHDQIGQSLTSVLLGLRLVIDTLAADEPDLADARGHAADVRGLVADALAEVRQLAFDLRPTVLDDVGLVAAVRRLAAEHTQRHGARVDVQLAGLHDDSRFPAEVETVVYRVVQEALTNVARHAKASAVTVSLEAETGCLRASVSDDGVGFEVPAGRPRSLGLAGMTERTTLIGGTLSITSHPAEGTSVALEVPVG